MSDTSHTEATEQDQPAPNLQELFQAQLDQEAQAPEVEEEQDVDFTGEGDVSSEPEFEEGDGDDLASEPDEVSAEPAIAPPHSLPADRQAAFAQLSPETQEWVAAREAQTQAEAVAEERKKLEAQLAETAQLREQYAQIVQQIVQAQPTPPDPKLLEEDPEGYQLQVSQYLLQNQQHQAAKAELDRVQKEQQAEIDRQVAAFKAEQDAKLSTLLPGATDPAKRTAMDGEIKTYVMSRGINGDLYDQSDAVAKSLAWKAMQYDRLVKGGKVPKATGKKPRSLKAGAGKNPKGPGIESVRQKKFKEAVKLGKKGGMQAVWAAQLEAEEAQKRR